MGVPRKPEGDPVSQFSTAMNQCAVMEVKDLIPGTMVVVDGPSIAVVLWAFDSEIQDPLYDTASLVSLGLLECSPGVKPTILEWCWRRGWRMMVFK